MSGKKVWNVVVPVVDLVTAPTETDAIGELSERLREQGFDPYEGEGSSAFLSDDQPEPLSAS